MENSSAVSPSGSADNVAEQKAVQFDENTKTTDGGPAVSPANNAPEYKAGQLMTINDVINAIKDKYKRDIKLLVSPAAQMTDGSAIEFLDGEFTPPTQVASARLRFRNMLMVEKGIMKIIVEMSDLTFGRQAASLETAPVPAASQ